MTDKFSIIFSAVAVSGISIITKGVPFTRRNRFILTAALTLGYGATLVPNYFSSVFNNVNTNGNSGLQGLFDAIELIMGSGFALTAFISMALNLTLPEEIEDTPAAEGAVSHGEATGILASQQHPKASEHTAGPVAQEGSAVGANDSMDGDEKYKRV